MLGKLVARSSLHGETKEKIKESKMMLILKWWVGKRGKSLIFEEINTLHTKSYNLWTTMAILHGVLEMGARGRVSRMARS